MKKLFLTALSILAMCVPLSAQTGTDPEQAKREKELYEFVEKEVDRLTDLLELEVWQTFYLDSILIHDYTAMQDEFLVLQSKKVSNSDIYTEVQMKWLDQMYYSIEKILDEEQWKKYLKQGAGKAKKDRDKKRKKAKN